MTSIVKKKKYHEVSGVHQLFGYRPFSKYLLLCSAEGKKEMNSGLEQLKSE